MPLLLSQKTRNQDQNLPHGKCGTWRFVGFMAKMISEGNNGNTNSMGVPCGLTDCGGQSKLMATPLLLVCIRDKSK